MQTHTFTKTCFHHAYAGVQAPSCVRTRAHTRVVATHMFLVPVSSAVAGDKSITGTEVQGGKRLSAPLFPPSRY